MRFVLRRLSVRVESVADVRRNDDLTFAAEVWLGPLRLGDTFTVAFHDPAEDAVALRVRGIRIDGVDQAQADSGTRVELTLSGDGTSNVRVGDLLLGES
jgi:hypothetical protein